MAQQRVLMNTP